jgi:hypothetical protein
MRGVAAIDVAAEEVHAERIAQLRHFDAVDTKAGVVLGFAGAITALSTGPVALVPEAGLLAAVLGPVRAHVLLAEEVLEDGPQRTESEVPGSGSRLREGESSRLADRDGRTVLPGHSCGRSAS